MPFSLSIDELGALVGTMPGLKAVHDVPMPAGRGAFFGKMYPSFWAFKPTRNYRGVYALLEFG